MASFRGLTRVRRGGSELAGSVYLARLTVPMDVRRIAEALGDGDPRRLLFIGPNGRAKAELLASTGHIAPHDAARAAEPILNRWRVAIAALRQHGNPEVVADALERIELWRIEEVARAQGFEVEIAIHDYSALASIRRGGTAPVPTPGLDFGGLAWAEAYFRDRPNASRETLLPPETFQLIDRLTEVDTGPERWRDVEGFDLHLDQVVGVLDPKVKAAIRPAFARAWRAVVEACEVERRHAAALLKIVEAQTSVVELSSPVGFEPRRGDKTVGELLDAYQAANPSKDAVAPARAVREFIGNKTLVRAVSRDDARRFATFAKTIPANATKRYPTLTMVEAAERAKEDRANSLDRPVLAPTSAHRYITYAAMFWNWGLSEGDGLWADRNPFRGLAEGADTATILRRGFKDDELIALFAHLSRHKASDSFRFWAPAVMLNGARLSEICQLRTDDVRDAEGVPFLKIHLFDADGRRDPMKSVKTQESIRGAPLHPLTIEAGFMDFVRRRRDAGAERLFGDAKPYFNGKTGQWDWADRQSRTLYHAIDVAVSTEPGLVVHSLRHSFRERAERADVAEAVIDAIAGWAQKTVGRGYGERDMPLLARNLAKLDYGGLEL